MVRIFTGNGMLAIARTPNLKGQGTPLSLESHVDQSGKGGPAIRNAVALIAVRNVDSVKLYLHYNVRVPLEEDSIFTRHQIILEIMLRTLAHCFLIVTIYEAK
jgi:hypothetical protein